MLTLNVEPRTTPMPWKTFVGKAPRRSIALDGYVSAGPRFNPQGPWANFNHHEEVSRLETRATCAQALIAIRQGLFDAFHNEEGNADAVIFVNDCDEDVCLSVFILTNHNLATGTMNPVLNRMVFMEDMLDTTAGAYPFPQDLETLQKLMWIFDPYHRFRVSGQLDRRDPNAFREVINDVQMRIMAHITGSGSRIELSTHFEKIGGGKGWAMVREIGQNARVGIFSEGIKAFVSVRERPDGKFSYTLCRSSQFVPFPIPKIVRALNREEKCEEDRWGGSDIVSGSPRIKGSGLDPDEITRIIEEIV